MKKIFLTILRLIMPRKKKVKSTEQLVCRCQITKHHREYVDSNNETVIECTRCLRFIKRPC